MESPEAQCHPRHDLKGGTDRTVVRGMILTALPLARGGPSAQSEGRLYSTGTIGPFPSKIPANLSGRGDLRPGGGARSGCSACVDYSRANSPTSTGTICGTRPPNRRPRIAWRRAWGGREQPRRSDQEPQRTGGELPHRDLHGRSRAIGLFKLVRECVCRPRAPLGHGWPAGRGTRNPRQSGTLRKP